MSSTCVRQIPSSGKGSRKQPPGEEFRQQVGDLRGVAGPVDAAGLDDHAGQALLDHQPLGDPVTLELRLLVVGGEFLAGVLVALVDDFLVGVAEGADGRDVDDLADLGLLGRPQDTLAAAHVGLVHRRVLLGGNADLVHRRGVDEGVAALHAGAQRGLVAEVAADDLTAECGDLFALLGGAHQADDLVAACPQLAHDLAADEPGSSRDEDLHGR